ncbi:MAG: hypothetical protein H6954_02335 [Chromatiaceae bacterium]|nr:hypothetical protein [Chromatiaceae bacterium]
MSTTMLIMLVGLGSELVLLLLVVLTVAFLRARAARKRDLKAAKTLIARIKNGKAERERALAHFLEHNMGMSGDALNQAKVALLRAELGVLKRFAGVYGQRQAGAAARFDDDLFAALESYQALSGSTSSPQAQATEQGTDDAEVEMLRKENERLSDELRITMETMSRMLNEYSTMFAGGSVGEDTPISSRETEEVAEGAATEELQDDELSAMSERDASSDAAEADAETFDGPAPAQGLDDAWTSEVEVAGAPADDEQDVELITPTNDTAPAVDPVAEIMRAAEEQEESARGSVDGYSIEIMGGDEEAFEVGPSEMLQVDDSGSDDDLVASDIDDLFDGVDDLPADVGAGERDAGDATAADGEQSEAGREAQAGR